MTANKRIAWMDIARAFAAVCVVLCHVIETSYYYVRMGNMPASSYSWYFQNILFTVGRFGVPIFLMLSGALLLGKNYEPKQFYKKSLLPLFITTEIWTVINYFYCLQLGEYSFELMDFLYHILFFKASALNHMWYMPMILGMYLVIPFLSQVVQKFSFRQMCLPWLVGLFAFSFIPLFNAIAGDAIRVGTDISLKVNVSFLGGIYGLLLILGYYIVKENLLQRLHIGILAAGFILCFLCNTVLARYYFVKHIFWIDLFASYTSPFILGAAICLFEMFRRIPVSNAGKCICLISKGSFAIFLMHNLFRKSFEGILSKNAVFTGWDIVVKSAVRFGIAFGLPLLVVWVVNMLPFSKIKKYIFFLK